MSVITLNPDSAPKKKADMDLAMQIFKEQESTSDEENEWQPPLQKVRALRAVQSHIRNQQAAWLPLAI